MIMSSTAGISDTEYRIKKSNEAKQYSRKKKEKTDGIFTADEYSKRSIGERMSDAGEFLSGD